MDTLFFPGLFRDFTVDECEFIPYMKAVIDGSNPTIVTARQAAKLKGIRSCMMYASTPGDLETTEGREFQMIIDNLTRFNEQMYDLTEEELEKMFDPPDNGSEAEDDGKEQLPLTMVYIEFNYVQLRKDEKYLRAQYLEAVAKNTLGEYRRGVLLQRFRGTDGSIFDQADIDYIQENVKHPDYTIMLMKKYNLYIYKHPIQNVDLTSPTQYFDIELPYMIGVDISTGTGGKSDNTAIVIMNPYTLQVVAELKSSYIGLLDLMRILTALAQIIPKAFFCIEANTVGKAIVDFVQESPLMHRFYYDPKLDITKNAVEMSGDPKAEMLQKAKARRMIGTTVTPTIRQHMFNLLKGYVHDYKELINTEFLVSDICNLVKLPNGRIEAASGYHDDVVMAYNHCIYILNFGANLERFGVDKHRCTFEKMRNVLDQYQHDIDKSTVDNMVPYDHPTMYEEQLLHDLTNPQLGSVNNGNNFVDQYGYSTEQYDRSNGLLTTRNHMMVNNGQPTNDNPGPCYSSSELASFMNMQVY